MSHRNIYEVTNNQITIKLPKEFKNNTRVLVTIDDLADTLAAKYLTLSKAASDPLFLADMEEVNCDFDSIDREVL